MAPPPRNPLAPLNPNRHQNPNRSLRNYASSHVPHSKPANRHQYRSFTGAGLLNPSYSCQSDNDSAIARPNRRQSSHPQCGRFPSFNGGASLQPIRHNRNGDFESVGGAVQVVPHDDNGADEQGGRRRPNCERMEIERHTEKGLDGNPNYTIVTNPLYNESKARLPQNGNILMCNDDGEIPDYAKHGGGHRNPSHSNRNPIHHTHTSRIYIDQSSAWSPSCDINHDDQEVALDDHMLCLYSHNGDDEDLITTPRSQFSHDDESSTSTSNSSHGTRAIFCRQGMSSSREIICNEGKTLESIAKKQRKNTSEYGRSAIFSKQGIIANIQRSRSNEGRIEGSIAKKPCEKEHERIPYSKPLQLPSPPRRDPCLHSIIDRAWHYHNVGEPLSPYTRVTLHKHIPFLVSPTTPSCSMPKKWLQNLLPNWYKTLLLNVNKMV